MACKNGTCGLGSQGGNSRVTYAPGPKSASFFKGTKDKFAFLDNLEPDQRAAVQQALQLGLGQLQNQNPQAAKQLYDLGINGLLGGQEGQASIGNQLPGAAQQLYNTGFNQIQNPTAGYAPQAQEARHNFQTETIPSLAERFTAMGGGQRSSAFQSALGAAGSNLERGLAADASKYGLAQQGLGQGLAGLGLQANQGQQSLAQQLISLGLGQGNQQQTFGKGLLGYGLQPRTESLFIPGQKSGIRSLGQSLIGGLGQGLGSSAKTFGAGLL